MKVLKTRKVARTGCQIRIQVEVVQVMGGKMRKGMFGVLLDQGRDELTVVPGGTFRRLAEDIEMFGRRSQNSSK